MSRGSDLVETPQKTLLNALPLQRSVGYCAKRITSSKIGEAAGKNRSYSYRDKVTAPAGEIYGRG